MVLHHMTPDEWQKFYHTVNELQPGLVEKFLQHSKRFREEQAIMSPEWSMHAAAGTYYYTFIWGVAGENLYYNDKDEIPVIDIR